MAYSSSIKKSQDILVCGLCESDTKIKVKCMDCDLYMCQKCVDKTHAKFKNADLHDIVALKDIHSHIDDTDGKSEFKPVKCKDHRKQLCCMFCLTCELLVCPMCIAKTHHLHLMEEIEVVCKNKVDEIKTLQDQAHTKIEKFIKKSKLMAEIEKSKSSQTEQNILQEENQAREVQAHCLRLLTEHKKKRKNHSEQMLKKETETLEVEKDINMIIQEMRNIYKSRNTEKFLEAASNLNATLKTLEQSISPKSLYIKTQQYVPSYKIQTNSKTIEIEIKFVMKGKYDTNIPMIASISSDNKGFIWIRNQEKIQQLRVEEKIQIIRSTHIKVPIFELRCWNQGILFTSGHIPEIMHLASDGKVEIFKDLSPCVPYTLHVSIHEIIVGLNCSSMEDKTDIPIIIRLAFNGEILQVYKNHGKKLLTRDVVRCCTSFIVGSICYIDSIFAGDYTGDVIYINEDGIIQWKYSGHSFINSNKKKFTPIEVLSTKSKSFVVSDENQNALHILTAQGELLTFIDLALIGLGEPGVMTIDVNGTLWISSKEINKTILSSVEYYGF